MLDLSTTVKGLHVVTTSLNHIPVEYPFLYLSPSEYRLVSTTPGSLCRDVLFANERIALNGSKNHTNGSFGRSDPNEPDRLIDPFCTPLSLCKHVKVNVVMRNPRTAFETNATTSSLATLNQNKFAVVAHNLTNITRGVNYKYGFGTTNAMNPTSCSDDNAKYQEELYKQYTVKKNRRAGFTQIQINKNTEKVNDTETEELRDDSYTKLFNSKRYFKPLECGQYIWRHGDDSAVEKQPSLHVGVYPVHKLTTTSQAIKPSSFTDIEVVFEVEMCKTGQLNDPVHSDRIFQKTRSCDSFNSIRSFFQQWQV
ncbi:uncharacterized protein LOC126555689 [Aphis gossypii]|uniref:uncharacterized protein LOC126555689 n=1 Tax=Aphis gossypii TaxID=80765 RepID=UPI002158C645|nr:uncharacterized protein LOC126555689 [Aphis gossypii]